MCHFGVAVWRWLVIHLRIATAKRLLCYYCISVVRCTHSCAECIEWAASMAAGVPCANNSIAEKFICWTIYCYYYLWKNVWCWLRSFLAAGSIFGGECEWKKCFQRSRVCGSARRLRLSAHAQAQGAQAFHYSFVTSLITTSTSKHSGKSCSHTFRSTEITMQYWCHADKLEILRWNETLINYN